MSQEPQLSPADHGEPWEPLLTKVAAPDHVVQLYQDERFLSRAVCRFAASAIENGEGIILVPTAAHWDAIRPRLEAEGVDVQAAQARHQLTIVDADELLPNFMREGMPQAPLLPRLGRGCRREGADRCSDPQGAVVGRNGERSVGAR